jgi:Transglycosylase SLT domain
MKLFLFRLLWGTIGGIIGGVLTLFFLIRPQPEILYHQTLPESILVEWVYQHSTLISHSTCQEIVRETLKTKYPLLLLSIIELESKQFSPGAISTKGCIGWCQINPYVHEKELIQTGIIKEKRDLWDTSPNIKAGDFILKSKFMKSGGGDATRALEGYLGGKDGEYVRKILTTFANLSILVTAGEKEKRRKGVNYEKTYPLHQKEDKDSASRPTP